VRRSGRPAKRRRSTLPALLIIAAAAGGGWWYFYGPSPAADPNVTATLPAAEPELAAQPTPTPREVPAEPDELLVPTGGRIASAGTVPMAAAPPSVAAEADAPDELDEPAPVSERPALAAARALLAQGRTIEARHAFNALLQQQLPRGEAAEARAALTRLADETLFSRQHPATDPLVDTYTVQPGDVLVRIGQRHLVPPEILMRINGIQDASRLRAEQKIKVLRGPFHVRISKSDFRLDVYLQDLFVRSFPVGLGADQGTPTGIWRVKERLQKPTYYPPASADIKRIIPPDDPENPLGGYWIGLEGVEGEAVGHTGYGIHGTIEPESIGKAVSLGCVRMFNDDVALLYGMLLPGESTVTILP
jgi:lipoprotein-anchoring transpeptidase ErfK/SrfK